MCGTEKLKRSGEDFFERLCLFENQACKCEVDIVGKYFCGSVFQVLFNHGIIHYFDENAIK